MKPIYISYATQDTAAMLRIVEFLQRRYFTVWTNDQLPSDTMDWQAAINGASAVVALLSPDAKGSELVAHEITYAQAQKRIIFPLLLQGDELSAVPEMLSASQLLDLRTENSFKQELMLLDKALRRIPDYMEKLNAEFIRNELVSFADSLPGITAVGLVSVDGLMVEFYRKSGKLEEDHMSAMSAAEISLGERISVELGGGPLRSIVVTGESAHIFVVAVGDDHVVIAVIQNVQSYDQVLAHIEAGAQRLLDLL